MPNCNFCGRPIVWMGTASGKRMPIDAAMRDLLIPGDVFRDKDGKPHAATYKRVKGYTSHLSTCPFADRFSSKGEKKSAPGGS